MEIKKEDCGFDIKSLTKEQKIYFKAFFNTIDTFLVDKNLISFGTYTYNGVCFSKQNNRWIIRYMQKDLVMFEDKFASLKNMLGYALTEYLAENKFEEESMLNYYMDSIDYYTKELSDLSK